MSIARAIRIASHIFLAIFALIVLGIALLHTPPVKRYALERVRGLLRGQNVEFNAAALNLKAGRLGTLTAEAEVRGDMVTVRRFQLERLAGSGAHHVATRAFIIRARRKTYRAAQGDFRRHRAGHGG